jgi:hypothetical protein
MRYHFCMLDLRKPTSTQGGQQDPRQDSQAAQPYSRLRTALKFSWLLIAVAAVYSGWILLERWDQNQRMQREAEQQKLESARRAVEALGGDRFEVLHFYATPGVVARGGEVQLCYGVANAKTVRLDPPAGSVWPSFGRCLYVKPEKDTTYTLTITHANGQSKSESLTIQVK